MIFFGSEVGSIFIRTDAKIPARETKVLLDVFFANYNRFETKQYNVFSFKYLSEFLHIFVVVGILAAL